MKEKFPVKDNRGFHYEVVLEHLPHFGFTNALYNDRIIHQVELNKLRQPMSDDDREWEEYEESFSEWRDEIKINMEPALRNYFSNPHN